MTDTVGKRLTGYDPTERDRPQGNQLHYCSFLFAFLFGLLCTIIFPYFCLLVVPPRPPFLTFLPTPIKPSRAEEATALQAESSVEGS